MNGESIFDPPKPPVVTHRCAYCDRVCPNNEMAVRVNPRVTASARQPMNVWYCADRECEQFDRMAAE